MISEGLEPLSECDGIGNFLHGSWDSSADFRNRAGVPIALLAGNASASGNILGGGDAHLVDFSMPAVTTPPEEAAVGLYRWNKAILFGRNKFYSIAGAGKFGEGGWPYRAPDGSVWFMQARFNNGRTKLQVYGGLLDDSFSSPAELLGSIDVNSGLLRLSVNFAPNGSKAAIHNRDGDDGEGDGWIGNAIVHFIVEAEVTAGSYSAAPTVALTLSYTTDNVLTSTSEDVPGSYTNAYRIVEGSLVSKTTTPILDPSGNPYPDYRRAIATYKASAVPMQTISPAGSINTSRIVLAVAYSKAGQRVELAAEYQTKSVAADGEFVPGQDWIEQFDEQLINGEWQFAGSGPEAITVLQYGTGSYKRTVTATRSLGVLSGGVKKASIEDSTVTESYIGGSTISVTQTGSAVAGGVSCFDVTPAQARPRVTMATSNGIVLWMNQVPQKLLVWAGADHSMSYQYVNAQTFTFSQFSFDPEAGTFSPTTIRWF